MIVRAFRNAKEMFTEKGEKLKDKRKNFKDELIEFRAAVEEMDKSEASLIKALMSKPYKEISFLDLCIGEGTYCNGCFIGLLADRVASRAFCAAQSFLRAYIFEASFKEKRKKNDGCLKPMPAANVEDTPEEKKKKYLSDVDSIVSLIVGEKKTLDKD